MLHEKTVAVIGLGIMGKALVAGLVASGKVPPGRILVSGRSQSSLDALRAEFSVKGFSSNAEAVRKADIAVLCVKPKDLAKVVGASREMVSRVMKDLQTSGYIDVRGSSIFLRDNIVDID